MTAEQRRAQYKWCRVDPGAGKRSVTLYVGTMSKPSMKLEDDADKAAVAGVEPANLHPMMYPSDDHPAAERRSGLMPSAPEKAKFVPGRQVVGAYAGITVEEAHR